MCLSVLNELGVQSDFSFRRCLGNSVKRQQTFGTVYGVHELTQLRQLTRIAAQIMFYNKQYY